MKNPPTPAARKLLRKLEALAERGINGERDVAAGKLARLKARYDFAMPDKGVTDLFTGVFKRAPYSSVIGSIMEPDIANSVKWAIETRTGIPCRFAGVQLLAEATPATAQNLERITSTVAVAFGQLWRQFEETPGVQAGDRRCFIAGLYDGLMNDERREGEPLPTRIAVTEKRSRCKRRSLAGPARLAVHPYTVAVRLGRQIRFNVSLDKIGNELDRIVKAELK